MTARETTNVAMRQLLTVAVDASDVSACVEQVAQILAAGVRLDDGLLLLVGGIGLPPSDAGLDAWETERWVNDVHLAVAETPLWQATIAAAARGIGMDLLSAAHAITPTRTIQVDYYVQPIESDVGDEQYFVGGLHLYQVSSPNEDLSRTMEQWAQPAGTLTIGAK